MNVLGLDIGGANLKAAHTSGAARLRPFALWKHPNGLAAALADLLQGWPPFELVAVTMTGELCDCYESKREGVESILDAVTAVAGQTPVRVWRNDGRFVEPAAARETPLATAAANWLALATFAGRYARHGGATLLLDVGSTTTDVVPLQDGRPVPHGRTDPERLRCRELVYTGVRRTPVCALVGPGECAAELFATTGDVYRILGELPEDSHDCDTADGRPGTHAASLARLARMLCADAETCSTEEVVALARQVAAVQTRLVRQAIDTVRTASLADELATVIVGGSGRFLAQAALQTSPALHAARVSLEFELSAGISEAACAYAVAVLAAEQGC